jgi:hypothetical protein
MNVSTITPAKRMKTNKKIKKLTIAIIIATSIISFFHASILPAQSFEWVKPYPVDSTFNFLSLKPLVIRGSDDLIAWITHYEKKEIYSVRTLGDFLIHLYDKEGTLLDSTKIIGKAGPGNARFDSGGNLILSVHIRSETIFSSGDTLPWDGNGINIYLVKLSPELEVVWFKNLTESIVYNDDLRITVGNNDEIYTGSNYTYGTRIQKYSADGLLLSQVDQYEVNIISALETDENGNIYATGSCASTLSTFNGVPYPTDLPYTVYVVKYNNQLQPQWVRYAGDITCNFPEIVYCDDNHIYLAGTLMTGTQFGNILLNGPSWGFDFFVARMNAAGEFYWANEVPSQQLTGDATVGSVMFMAADDDKNIYLSGFQRGVVDWGGGFTTVGNNLGYDILTLKYDPSGEMLSAKVAGGGLYDWANSIATGTGGSWYIAGTIWNEAAFDTININAQGVSPFIAKIDFESTSTRIASNDGLPAISVYPNPVTRFLYISQVDQINKIDRFLIYNEMGELTILQNDNQLSCVDMSSLRSGLYFVTILFHDGSTSAVKVVKR